MKWSVMVRNITVGALAGGVLGLLAGLLLVWLTDSVDNPFWGMSIGIGRRRRPGHHRAGAPGPLSLAAGPRRPGQPASSPAARSSPAS